jgi:hypothetical protein
MPGSDLSDQRCRERIALFQRAYGQTTFPDDVLLVAVERCTREAELVDRLGEAGEPPYDRLLREGHGELWHAAGAHIADHAPDWQEALNDVG